MADVKQKVARLAGDARSVVARIMGKPELLLTLRKEHIELIALLNRVERTGGSEKGLRTRHTLYPQIRSSLLRHMRAEEATLYAELRKRGDAQKLVALAIDEHAQIRRLSETLDTLEPHDPAWVELFEKLADRVEEHFSREEAELFPRIRKLSSKWRHRALHDEYERAKATGVTPARQPIEQHPRTLSRDE